MLDERPRRDGDREIVRPGPLACLGRMQQESQPSIPDGGDAIADARPTPSDAQQRAIGHGEGPLLVLGGAGTGKSEALVQRLSALAAGGTGPEEVLILASTRATARHLRERAELLLEQPFEELWIGTWETICESLLRTHAAEAGIDPFFEMVGPAERLAMLLDRIEQLPLRHHEIRGNPAGLLARLLGRIDALKAEAVEPGALADWAAERGRTARDEAARERARREREFAALYAEHDRIVSDAGGLDSGDVVLALGRVLAQRADVRREIAGRFRYLMVDELEDATLARWAVLAELGSDTANLLCTLDDDAAAAVRARARPPGSATFTPTPTSSSSTAASAAARTSSTPRGPWWRGSATGSTSRGGQPMPRFRSASGVAATSAPRRRPWRVRSSI